MDGGNREMQMNLRNFCKGTLIGLGIGVNIKDEKGEVPRMMLSFPVWVPE